MGTRGGAVRHHQESGGLWQAWDSAGREGAPRLAHGLESPRVGAKRKSNALVRGQWVKVQHFSLNPNTKELIASDRSCNLVSAESWVSSPHLGSVS